MSMARTVQKTIAQVASILMLVNILVWIFTLTVVVLRWKADQAPDIFADEIIYTRIGIRVQGEKALVWDSGEPFLVHPPLYFLAAGIYQGFTGDQDAPLYAAGDIFSSVYHMRGLNAVFAGLTAVIIFLFGRRLNGFWFGLFLVSLFILDPFSVRINRRAMLETLTAFLTLWGVYTLIYDREKSTFGEIQRGIQAGLGLGLAMLAKELAFITVVAVSLFGVWEIARTILTGRRFSLSLIVPFLATTIAGVTYSIYPAWIWSIGQWEPFVDEKLLGVWRLLGLVQITGWNRPGLSLVDLLLMRFLDYGSTYLMLGLGGIATIYLLFTAQAKRTGRLLSIWGLMLYSFFGFTALFGSGNDQFFYLLLVPTIVIVGYAITTPFTLNRRRYSKVQRGEPYHSSNGSGGGWNWNSRDNEKIYSSLPAINLLVLKVLLILTLPYNATHWILTFGVGQDNGYYQLARFGQEHLPPGMPINASGDPVKFRYFFPDRLITTAATPEEAQAMSVHYFALAPKDVRSRYGRIKPELASWVLQEGEQLFAYDGNSYGDIYLYRVDYPDKAQGASNFTPSNDARWRSFKPATGGIIGALFAVLVLWVTVWQIIVAGMAILRRISVASSTAEKTQPIRVQQVRNIAGRPHLEVRREIR